MTSLVQAIKSFRNGHLSREELFATVDSILETGRADEAWLLETLDKENTRVPLPEDVHARVQGKIEQAAENRRHAEAGDVGEDPDPSQTRLATSLFVNVSAPAPAAEVREWSAGFSAPAGHAGEPGEVEPMKGQGDVLKDRFVLEECIGTGGMSTVYKALDRRKLEANDRNPYVAVKVLNLEFRAHPDSLIALQREAKKSQSLAHPNIVRVYDFDRDGSTVYMTMEYLPGQSLASILRAPGFRGLPESRCMEILEAVARALHFAHENGIIHADFKPANVILTDDNKVKVIDFGISRAFQKPEDTDMEATRFDPGTLGALTPTYASPEMLEHQDPDPRDDVYALACITYEMLTGRHPFGRMQATEARDGGLLPERRKHLSRRQWKALKSALHFDREKRTPDIMQFLVDMRPKYGVAVPPLLATVAKMGLVAAAGLLVFYYLDSGQSGRYLEEIGLLSRVDEGGGQDDTAMASLEVGEPGETSAAADGDSTGEKEMQGPAVSRPEAAAVLASVENDSVVAVPELKPSLDAVRALLDPIPCSVFDVSLDDGVVSLQGYVSNGLDTLRLQQDIAALPGISGVDARLRPVDAAQCAVVELLGPYWIASRKAGAVAAIRSSDNVLVEGDPLVIELDTPAYETWVNIDYFSLDGGVVHMVPGPRAPDNQAPPDYSATIGDLGEWRIAGPFGSELVTVLLTPAPLFADSRPEYEAREDYLKALETRLQQLGQGDGATRIAVEFLPILTRPRS